MSDFLASLSKYAEPEKPKAKKAKPVKAVIGGKVIKPAPPDPSPNPRSELMTQATLLNLDVPKGMPNPALKTKVKNAKRMVELTTAEKAWQTTMVSMSALNGRKVKFTSANGVTYTGKLRRSSVAGYWDIRGDQEKLLGSFMSKAIATITGLDSTPHITLKPYED
jgi:hypothetical protein